MKELNAVFGIGTASGDSTIGSVVLILAIINALILCVFAYSRLRRGPVPEGVQLNLMKIGQWKVSDGWSPKVYICLAALSLAGGMLFNSFL